VNKKKPKSRDDATSTRTAASIKALLNTEHSLARFWIRNTLTDCWAFSRIHTDEFSNYYEKTAACMFKFHKNQAQKKKKHQEQHHHHPKATKPISMPKAGGNVAPATAAEEEVHNAVCIFTCSILYVCCSPTPALRYVYYVITCQAVELHVEIAMLSERAAAKWEELDLDRSGKLEGKEVTYASSTRFSARNCRNSVCVLVGYPPTPSTPA